MQTFMKICSVVMKLNHFLPSTFSQTAYTHIPDTKSVIVCSIWYWTFPSYSEYEYEPDSDKFDLKSGGVLSLIYADANFS